MKQGDDVMKNALRTLSWVAILLTASVLSALAQSEAKPTWVEIRTMTVKGDCVDQWRDVQKNAVSPALKKSGVPWREAWQTATFGTTRQYTFVTPIADFAQYDRENQVKIAEDALDVLARCNLDHRVQAALLQPELSKIRDASKPPKIAIVTVEQLAPGKREEWEDLIRTQVLPAMKKSPASGYHVLQNVFGGPVEFVSVEFLDSMAEIDAGPMTRRVLGREAGAEIGVKRQALRTYTERWISRYDSELSFSSMSTSSR
jgi:hypothetical protein